MKRILAALLAATVLSSPAWADCPAAPVGSTNDMVVSFLAGQGGTQAAPSIMFPSSVKEGMLVYDDATKALKICNGTAWQTLDVAGSAGSAAGTVTGAVQFRSSTGAFAADDTNFVWDDTNNRLGIGMAVPMATLHVTGPSVMTRSIADASSTVLSLQNNAISATPGTAIEFQVLNTNARAYLLYQYNSGHFDFRFMTPEWGQPAKTRYGVFHTSGAANTYQYWNRADGTEAMRMAHDGSIGIGTASVDASAVLDVASTTKGLLPPRMTTALVTAVANPADGLIVYDTDTDTIKLRANGAWVDLLAGAGSEADPQVGILTASKWCAANAGATAIDCTADAPTTSAAGSASEIQFRNSGTGAFAADSALVWDDANNRLGVGTNSPIAKLSIAPGIVASTAIAGQSIYYGSLVTPVSGRSGYTVQGTNSYLTTDDNAAFGFVHPWDATNAAAGYKVFRITTGAESGATDTAATAMTDRFYVRKDGGAFFASNVGIGASTPSPSALLDITSTTKGLLPPRMTTAQRDAIATPATGLEIYNTTTNQPNFYNGTAWTVTGAGAGGGASGTAGYVQVSDGAGGFTTSGTTANQQFFWDNTNKRLGIGTAAPLYRLDIRGASSAVNLYGSGSVAYNLNSSDLSARMFSLVTTGNSVLLRNNTDSSGSFILRNSINSDIFTVDYGAPTESFSLASSGNIGIGTISPASKLHIHNAAATTIGTNVEVRLGTAYSTNNYSFIRHLNANNGGGNLVLGTSASGAGYGAINFTASNNMHFTQNGVDTLFLDGGNAVGIRTVPNASAVLDVASTTKGFLPPRMTTTERNAIATPTDGLTLYNTTTDGLETYSNGFWQSGAALRNVGRGTSGNYNTIIQNTPGGIWWMDGPGSTNGPTGTNTGTLVHLDPLWNQGASANQYAIQLATNGNAGDKLYFRHQYGGTWGNWVDLTAGGGGGTPGGASTQVQFNDGGAFRGDANFVWDNTNKRLGVGTAALGTNDALTLSSGNAITGMAIRSANTSTRFKHFDGGAGGDALLDINPVPQTSSDNAYVRLFRDTNTTGGSQFIIYRGDGTTTANALLSGNSHSYVNQTVGNFGIGTTTPAAKLDVAFGNIGILVGADNGNVSTRTDATAKNGRIGAPHYMNAEEPTALVMGSSSSTNNDVTIGGGTTSFNAATLLRFFTAANTTTITGTERMRIDGAGNVGIGTASPANLLSVGATPDYAPGAVTTIRTDSAANKAAMLIETGGNGVAEEGLVVYGRGSTFLGDLVRISSLDTGGYNLLNLVVGEAADGTGDISRMVVTAAGNVGIGTTNPASKFVVNTGTNENFAVFSGSAWGVPGNGVALQSYNDALSLSQPLSLQGSAIMMQIFGGNVGIGTTSPGSALDVKGAIRLSGSTSGYIGLAPAAVAGSTTYTLPAADGTTGQVLSTNGAGLLSWATAGGGGVPADSLDFTEFKDAMTLDTSTDIAASGTNALSITNSGTGASFRINDQASDTTPFIIDGAGKVAVGAATTEGKLLIADYVASSTGALGVDLTIRNTFTGDAADVSSSRIFLRSGAGSDPHVKFWQESQDIYGSYAGITSSAGNSFTIQQLGSSLSLVAGTTLAANARSTVISQSAVSGGNNPGLVYTGTVTTAQTAATEIPAVRLTTAGRQWATGALATQREVLITQPTYSFVGASTITDAATLGIAGAPVKGTNATITNSHGLWVQPGAVSTATNSYGMTVNAQTGATNNYAAALLGGNVGIGTTGPSTQLHISRSTTPNTSQITLTNPDPYISSGEILLDSTHASGKDFALGHAWSSDSFSVRDLTSGGAPYRFIIDGSGNVGIGTASPGNNRLNVAFSGAGAVTAGLALNDTSASGGGVPYARFQANGTTIGSVVASGPSSVAYNTTSDRRLKMHIAPTQRGLAELMMIEVEDFEFISDPKEERVQGFIAQQLHKVYPEAVTVGGEDAQTRPWAVDYGRVTPLLVKAMQDLKAANDNLKTDNAELRNALDELRGRVEKVEALKSAH